MESSDFDDPILMGTTKTGDIEVTREYISSMQSIKEMTITKRQKYFEEIINKANEFAKNRDTTMALAIFSRLLSIIDTFEFNPSEYDEKIATILHNQGTVFWQIGDLKEARDLLIESLQLYQKSDNKPRMANTLNNLGLVHYNMGDFTSAESYIIQSIKISETQDNAESIIQSKNNLAMIFEQKGDFIQASKYYNYCLKFAQSNEMALLKAILSTNSANLDIYFGNSKRAFERYSNAKTIFETTNPTYLGDVFDGLGRLYGLQGNYEQAIHYYRKSLVHKERLGIQHEISSTLAKLVEISLLSNIEQPINYYERLKDLNSETENPIVEIYFQLTKSIVQIHSSRQSIKYQAMDTLRQFSCNKQLQFDIRFTACNYLAQLLFSEFNASKDHTILTEIEGLIGNLDQIDKLSQTALIRIQKLILEMFLTISKLDRDGSNMILEELMELIHTTGYNSYLSLIAQFSENIERIKLIKSKEFPLELNELLHSQPRLNIMTYLLFNPNTSFSILRKETGFTSGKLINHCNKLEEEGYILRSTEISSNGAVTLYNISNKGNSELQKYAHQLSKLTSYFA